MPQSPLEPAEIAKSSPLLERMDAMNWQQLYEFMSVMFLGAAQQFTSIEPIGLAHSTACVRLIDELYGDAPDKDAQISAKLVALGWPAHEDWRALILGLTHSARVYPILNEFGFRTHHWEGDKMVHHDQLHLRRAWRAMMAEQMQQNPDLEAKVVALLNDTSAYRRVNAMTRQMGEKRREDWVIIEDIVGQFGRGLKAKSLTDEQP